MRMKAVMCFAALLVLVGIAATQMSWAADDPAAGTWVLNVAKSKYSPGPAPKSATVTISIDSGTENYKMEGVGASGAATSASFSAKLDGTDAAVTGIPYADMVSVKRMSPTHYVAKMKKDGKVVMTVNIVMAANGKSRTLTYTGKNEKGDAVHDVVVYDKQM
jgi:hypothetical protein